MAVIFLARQPALERDVALKRLDLRGREAGLAERFLREAKLAGSFGHPNIVTVHDFFEHDGHPYIAMEYLRRGSLRSFLDRGLTPAQTYGVLEGILSGLAHAASQGVVHRDMKPENILVTSRGGVKIADFGIAKAFTKVTVAARLTETGMALGTPHYMAPEQALAEPVGPYTDLYAVGAMAYEMVSGRTPFEGPEQPMAILLRHVNDPPPPLPGVDPRLARWLDWLLAKHPADRPGDAEEAWEHLEEIAVDQLGSYWRRAAGLLDPGEVGPLRRTPTPAPSQHVAETPREPDVATPAGQEALTPPLPDVAVGLQTPPGSPVPSADEPPAGEPSYVSFERPAVRPDPPVEAPIEPERPQELVPEPVGRVPEPDVEAPRGQPLAPVPEPVPAEEPPRPEPVVFAPEPAELDWGPVRLEPEQPVDDPAVTLAPTHPPTSRVARERRRRNAPWFVAGAAALAVVAAGLAYAAAPTEITHAPTPLASTVGGHDLRLRVPAGWRTGDPASIPGLELRDGIALRPPGAAGNDAVLAGWSDTTDAALVPAAARKPLGDPRPARVRLGGAAAFAYGPVSASGSRYTLYAIPTSAGVATIACRGAAGGEVSRSCDAIARSLRLERAKPFGLPPRAELARDVDAIVARLRRDETAAGRELGRATTARRQASALRRLAGVYGSAARSLDGVTTAPSETAAAKALTAHVRRLERDARGLAQAASRGQAKQYAQRRGELRGRRDALPARVQALAAIGRDGHG